MNNLRLFLIIFLMFILGSAVNADAFSEYVLPEGVILYSTSSRLINAFDPSIETSPKQSLYPGFRGANQLVVYTRDYGERTNTNEFGGEAIVVDDTVVALSGADSVIPENGLVISGHGSAKTWINKNLIVGTKIYIDKENNTITAYTTSDSYLYGARECLKEVREVMSFYKHSELQYNQKKIEDCIEDAENCIKKALEKPARVQEFSQMAIGYANQALAMAVPYKHAELKGVWIRPTCRNRDDVINVIERLADAGINNIFLETYYHGMTIFPSKTMQRYGYIVKNPIFGEFDVLEAFITEAHKRNIKVNIWFETFYVGNKKPDTIPQSILSMSPTWANVTKKDFESDVPVKCPAEHNGYFLDPANPEVQSFLLEMLTEIIETYKPDGINIDYIRYPQSYVPKCNDGDLSAWGYSYSARADFQAQYEVDPIDITPCDECWQTWCDYRRGKITEFVKSVSQLCRSKNILLTAVIFPNRYTALEHKNQDWKTWSEQNLIDGFTPLFLTCDPETASTMMKGVIKHKSSKTKLYAGVFVTFMNGSQSDLVRQIHELRKLKLDGFSVFDYAHFPDEYINTLKQSITTEPPKVKRDRTKQENKKKKLKTKKNRKYKKQCE